MKQIQRAKGLVSWYVIRYIGASSLENMITGKGFPQVCEGRTSQKGQGTIRAENDI